MALIATTVVHLAEAGRCLCTLQLHQLSNPNRLCLRIKADDGPIVERPILTGEEPIAVLRLTGRTLEMAWQTARSTGQPLDTERVIAGTLLDLAIARQRQATPGSLAELLATALRPVLAVEGDQLARLRVQRLSQYLHQWHCHGRPLDATSPSLHGSASVAQIIDDLPALHRPGLERPLVEAVRLYQPQQAPIRRLAELLLMISQERHQLATLFFALTLLVRQWPAIEPLADTYEQIAITLAPPDERLSWSKISPTLL